MLADLFFPAPLAPFEIPLTRVPSNPALPPASYAPFVDLDLALDGPWVLEPFPARFSPPVVSVAVSDVYRFVWPGTPTEFDPAEVVPFLAAGISFGAFTGPPPPSPSPPVPVHAGHIKPFVERDVTADQRLRRHTEKVSMMLNSLMRFGELYQTAPEDWHIAFPPPVVPPVVPPTPVTYTSGTFTV